MKVVLDKLSANRDTNYLFLSDICFLAEDFLSYLTSFSRSCSISAVRDETWVLSSITRRVSLLLGFSEISKVLRNCMIL